LVMVAESSGARMMALLYHDATIAKIAAEMTFDAVWVSSP